MNLFKKHWNTLENETTPPTRLNKLKTIDFNELYENVRDENPKFSSDITNALYSGDVFIIKNAFDREFLDKLKIDCYKHFANEESSFHKMLENCPDFHRKIDEETGKKYSFRVCKHAFYFYKWNKDPLNIFPKIYKRWRVIKKLMGLDETEYENNTPKNGVVDRIQVVRYPSKYGFLEPHSDPYKFQRLFISGYMSEKGKDYNDGGFYVINKDNKVVDVEQKIECGDMGIGYATIIHGVAPANRDKEPEWSNPNDGRWFLSMYTNQSDEVKDRHTGYSVTEKLKIDDPVLFPPN
jgi:hypothetical protein